MLPFNTTFSTKFELQRKINMPGSSRARSTRGQENEAWAVYKKNPSRESWDDLSGDQYIICLKPPSPAGRILDRRQLFFLANHNSLEQTPRRRPNLPPQDFRDGFFLYTAQALFSWPHVDLARLLRRACSRSFWIISFEFVKVCGIRFSIWESFIGFYICCYPISTILACLFSVGVRISWKKLCWKGAWRRRWHLVSPTLYIIIVYQ